MGRRLLIASETAVRGRNRLEKSVSVQPFWGHCWAFWRVFHLEYEELMSDKNKKKKKRWYLEYLESTAWSRIPETKGQ